ncbi:MAG: RpiB/LacA/LacB family sugar-phosphate isomerase [Patescibacteria group bacterium]
MKIILATDHAGFELKEAVKKMLIDDLHMEVEDCGAFTLDPADDYPDFIFPAAKKVAENPGNCLGIIFGGSGQGEAICANRVKGIRAAVYYGGSLNLVRLSRQHNDSNILSMGARFLDFDQAMAAVTIWLDTIFEGGRHKKRIEKLDSLR